MQDVVAFLSANRTVFVATTEQGAPRVRPFQFQFATEGGLWFCTARSKAVFAQLQADPRLELAATSAAMATLRVRGEVILDDAMAVKRRILEESPMIRSIYGTPDNPDFTVFRLDHGSAQYFDFSGQPPRTWTF